MRAIVQHKYGAPEDVLELRDIDDKVGNCRRVLTPRGILQPNSGGHHKGRWIGRVGGVFKAFLASLFVRRQGRPFVSMSNREGLAALKDLSEAGKVSPVIDRTYPLSETAAAVRYLGEGHARGKVVLTL